MDKPRFETRPVFTVAGPRYYGKNENSEIKQMWDERWPEIESVPDQVDSDVCYGVCITGEEEHGPFTYIAGMEVDSVDELPAELAHIEIPEQTYAVFRTTLPEIGKSYDYIYGEWLPKSGYRRAPGPEFELYPETFDPDNPQSLFDLYVPVVKE